MNVNPSILLAPFLNGFFHPLHGMDHLMMAVGVGLWSVVGNRTPEWKLPLVFLATLASGFGWGVLGTQSWGTSQISLEVPISLVLLSLFFFSGVRLAPWMKFLAVALFGMLHGHTHGVEMGGTSFFRLSASLSGLLLATAVLHFSGMAGWVVLRRFLKEPQTEWALRLVGVIVLSSSFLGEI